MSEQEIIERREFLARSVKAAAAIAASTAVAFTLRDNKGPIADPEANKLVKIADLSVKPVDGKSIAIVSGSDRKKCVNAAIKMLGGIERFIAKDDTVVIKPNVAFASPAILNATAHPQLVAEAVKLCYQAGAKKVIVTDNPINDPQSCFTISGIAKAASESGAEILLPRESFFRPTTLEGGKLIRQWPVLYEPLAKADKLIGISPVKDHHRSGASMTMKNFYGLLGGPRNIFHQDINTIIAELATLFKPTLVILDGTVSMMTNGPTGGSLKDLKKTNTIIASTDMVAADAYACRLLNMKVSDLPYLSLAQKAKAGTADFESLKPIMENVA